MNRHNFSKWFACPNYYFSGPFSTDFFRFLVTAGVCNSALPLPIFPFEFTPLTPKWLHFVCYDGDKAALPNTFRSNTFDTDLTAFTDVIRYQAEMSSICKEVVSTQLQTIWYCDSFLRNKRGGWHPTVLPSKMLPAVYQQRMERIKTILTKGKVSREHNLKL